MLVVGLHKQRLLSTGPWHVWQQLYAPCAWFGCRLLGFLIDG